MNIKRNILLNPGPATTSDEVKHAMLMPDICPREEEFCLLMESVKQDLPKIVNGGADYTSTLFAASGTGGIESAITSAVPCNGRLLVIDNGAYGARMAQIAKRYAIYHVVYKIPYGDYPDVTDIEKIVIDEKITTVSIVDHETTTGMRNPVQEVCEIAHRHGSEIIVDCMSSFAGLPIDLRKWGAEYIISSSNKCIEGMAGLSFVIFQKSLLEKIKGTARSFYFDLYAQYQGFQHAGQMQFTPPVQVIYALRKAIDLLFAETYQGRINRYKENYSTLKDETQKLGFQFLLKDEYQSGILLYFTRHNLVSCVPVQKVGNSMTSTSLNYHNIYH
ncbi:MAG: aminotransferase class V-fold PLP-dependent enzyme [Dysgonamonadaceae bacterium]|jgi:2-aminoethylphosphonate aminotransferase|nr:aminotransferase class V-fold PLP-dependent enzyme [Dysgonamonadaceae bacterium]